MKKLLKKELYENIMKNVSKVVKNALLENNLINDNYRIREIFEEKYPNLYHVISEFCRAKNTEIGVDVLIASFINSEKYKKFEINGDIPFNGNDFWEFEDLVRTNDLAADEYEIACDDFIE